jgi:hypothetical protein
MKWITRKNIKVDRVACPWLIRQSVIRLELPRRQTRRTTCRLYDQVDCFRPADDLVGYYSRASDGSDERPTVA